MVAIITSVIIIGMPFIQSVNLKAAIETPLEESPGDDAEDDFDDDKLYTSHHYLLDNSSFDLSHYTVYMLGHVSLAKEISTPPPKI